MYKVLFVCSGNTCRSPTAEGVFRHRINAAGLVERIAADSVGTGSRPVGDPPDPRAIEAARARGYDLTGLRARQLQQEDFTRFDLLLTMDRGHRDHLLAHCPRDKISRVRLFLELTPETGHSDVPDPYHGDMSDYELALDLIEQGTQAWLDHIEAAIA